MRLEISSASMSQLLTWARYARAIPLLVVARRSESLALIERDAVRTADRTAPPNSARLSTKQSLAVIARAEFRSVLYARLSSGSTQDELAAVVLKRLWPGKASLDIACPQLGAGFVIHHGNGSVVAARSIGEDCEVWQQVTLGLTDRGGDYPTVGHRVRIYAGAIILGPVHIGDDAVIGAGAVVLDDVAAGTTVVGVPARPTGPARLPTV